MEQLPRVLRPAPDGESEQGPLARIRDAGGAEVLGRVGTVEVPARSLRRALEGEWLDDQIVTAATALVARRATRCRALALDSYFYPCAASRVPAAVARNYDVLFFPVNIDNAHWVLVAHFTRRNSFVYYDSLGADLDAAFEVMDSLRNRVEGAEKARCAVSHDAEHQRNGSDCGLFVVAAAACIAECTHVQACACLGEEWAAAVARRRIAVALVRTLDDETITIV
jgi:Ulp1 family protease